MDQASSSGTTQVNQDGNTGTRAAGTNYATGPGSAYHLLFGHDGRSAIPDLNGEGEECPVTPNSDDV